LTYLKALKRRLGIPSASMFDKIITSTGKPSASSKTYMNQLLADWFAGHPVDAFDGNVFTEAGNEREAESRALYELITGEEVQEIGFCYLNEDRLVGCSPDGLVGEDGLLEIKNPKGSTFIEYYLSDKEPSKYKPQIQGQLWITGRDWCDFMFRHPDLDLRIIRVYRDNEYIQRMEELVFKFIERMLKYREMLTISKG